VEQLWGDERITAELQAVGMGLAGWQRGERLLRAMRDEYEAQLAAAQGGEWQPAAAAPSVPGPDWSQAPKWAMWWAMDQDGWAHWFERRPKIVDHEWWNSGQIETACDLGEWDKTLQRRPQAGAGE
jgi:hypothetical protein